MMTEITGRLLHADNAPAYGTAVISWPAFQIHSTTIVGGQKMVDIVDGNFSVDLYPNITAHPRGTYYTVRMELDNGAVYEEFWIVPDLPTATVEQVRSSFPLEPGMAINPMQIAGSGAVAGMVISYNGSYWVPGYASVDNIDPNWIRLDVGSSGTDVWIDGSPVQLGRIATIHIPSASATARGLVTTGAQSFGGNKTFDDSVVIDDDLLVNRNTSLGGSLVVTGPITSPTISDIYSQIDAAEAGAVPITRRIDTGAGLKGGGDLSADRTLTADVVSVFGRLGAVTAQSGDYTAAQVGAVSDTRRVNSGTGLTGGGALTSDITLSVVDSTTIQNVWAQVDSAAKIVVNTLRFVAGSNIALTQGGGGAQFDVTIAATGLAPAVHTHGWGEITSKPATFPPDAHVHAAADVTTGVFAVARLGSGTPSASNYLRGDGTWSATPNTGHTIQDEGTPLAARAGLNFVGPGVTASDDPANNRTTVVITGGGEGGSQTPWLTDIDANNKVLFNLNRMVIGTPGPSDQTVVSGMMEIWYGGAGSELPHIHGVATTPGLKCFRQNGTAAAPTAVLASESLLLLSGHGYDSSVHSGRSAAMQYFAAENWTPTAHGSYIIFETTAVGSTTVVERMRIDAAGFVGIGKIPAAHLNLAAVNSPEIRLESTAIPGDNTSLSGLTFASYDGVTSSLIGATINGRANGAWSASNRGTDIVFRGISGGATALVEWVRMRNASVGIGVTPEDKLDVNGSVRIRDRGDGYGSQLSMRSGNTRWDLYSVGASGSLVFYGVNKANGAAGPGAAVTVTDSGWVGINLTNPAAQLHVHRGVDNVDVVCMSGAEANKYIAFQSNATEGRIFHWAGSGYGTMRILGGNVIIDASLNVGGTVTAPTFSGALSGNATSATNATNASNVPWTGVTGKPVLMQAGLSNQGTYSVAGTGMHYANGAFEIREANFGGSQGGAINYWPHIGFHWAGLVASNIGMDASGEIQVRDNPGTGYANFRCNFISAMAGADVAGNVQAYAFNGLGFQTGGSGASPAPGANQILRSNSDGYVSFGWVHNVSGDMGESRPARIYASNDGFIRYQSAGVFARNLNSATSQHSEAVGLAWFMPWKNYGAAHIIFDASNGTAPNGAAISNTNPGNNYVATYPCLMGWNGSTTFGVRVDTCRYADSAGSATLSMARYGDLKASRTQESVYTNNTGKWMWVSVYCLIPTNFQVWGQVDTVIGDTVQNLAAQAVACAVAWWVGPGQTYKLTKNGVGTISVQSWYEWY